MMVCADLMHRCGVSGIAQGDQQAQGQSRTHRICAGVHTDPQDGSVARYDRDRRAGIRDQTKGELVTARRKHCVLSFKPQRRLEWRGQDGQNETEQPDHSANLRDSITASTRMRFSVHTTRRCQKLCAIVGLESRFVRDHALAESYNYPPVSRSNY